MEHTALENIRVLDLSRILAGPWCTQILADLGAEILKIEHPVKGDDTRHLGPPWMTDMSGNQYTDATYYASTNRGKKSVGIDISTPEGAEIVRTMAKRCDVFIENFKVGNLARYGLDYESIRKVNPNIIYCSITGYGQTGPYSKRPGYDFIFQAEGGLMSITGERDDMPGGGPQKSGIAIADLTTGLYATIAILAALNHRRETGQGQYIDMSLLDCVVALGSNQGTSYLMNGINPRRLGNGHPALVPYQVFDASDEKVVVAVANDTQWQQFCLAIERKDLELNPDYKTASGRIVNRNELIKQAQATIKKRPAEYWLATFHKFNVPNGKINDYEEVFSNAQVLHRNMVVQTTDENGDEPMKMIANPIKLSQTPLQHKSSPPPLGRHTVEVLNEVADLSNEEIQELASNGLIFRPDTRKEVNGKGGQNVG